MTDLDDTDGLAAEYVLGSLNAAERAAVAMRRPQEPALERAITAWEARLGPLAELVPPAMPPAGLFQRIEARIDGARRPATATAATRDRQSADVIDLSRRMHRWRTAAMAASTMAASLLLVVGWQNGLRPMPQPDQAKTFVAVLQKDAAAPAFLVTVDMAARALAVRPVSAPPPADKSYELWLVHDSLPGPRSLGLIAQQDYTMRPSLAAYRPEVVTQATFAVSLEPKGGSTTGAPTGPVLFTGKLVQATR